LKKNGFTLAKLNNDLSTRQSGLYVTKKAKNKAYPFCKTS